MIAGDLLFYDDCAGRADVRHRRDPLAISLILRKAKGLVANKFGSIRP